MAVGPATPALTMEEFERLYGGETPAYEYWDGLAIQKPVPTVLHSWLQFVLQVLLKQKGLAAAAEVRIKVNPTKEPVPDVIAGHRPRAPYPDKPVEIVMEVLSPDDTVQRLRRKCRFYAAQQIPGIYVFDPEDRTSERWSSADNAL
jgi:Uma2 family endonuclease